MYRYSVDNAVTYSTEDFILFRESPFACWMERLTLENPDHGIPADRGSLPPRSTVERQDDMADTLHAEGKDVCLVDWDAAESERRAATLAAMRSGADFIVNGQLALGPLSGGVNLLVRTSGYSQLGNYLYIPCHTQPNFTHHAPFQLSFVADLLHSLQGQLPPQLLLIRDGDNLAPLDTESHIYHYRAVKLRFMDSMRNFRKHRMPDPAESSHFGRWADCAHEVLKQRLLRAEQAGEGDFDEAVPLRKAMGAAAGGTASAAATAVDSSEGHLSPAPAVSAASVTASQASHNQETVSTGSFTLAEQARQLQPGTYKPGPGVYRVGQPRASQGAPVARSEDNAPPEARPLGARAPVAEQPQSAALNAPAVSTAAPATPLHNRRASDRALRDLEFIGSRRLAGSQAETPPAAAPAIPGDISSTAPSPTLRDPRRVQGTRSAFDMDATHVVTPATALSTATEELVPGFLVEEQEIPHGFGQAASAEQGRRPAAGVSEDTLFNDRLFTDGLPAQRGDFSDSLMTSEDYDA